MFRNKDETTKVIERVIVETQEIQTIKVIKTVQEFKDYLLSEWKLKMSQAMDNPIVEVVLPRATPLTIFVDGGRSNKDDFKEKYEDMLIGYVDENEVTIPEETTTVKDANNAFIPDVTKSEMFLIYKAIYKNGEFLYGLKWSKAAEINDCTTLEQLEAVEI